MDILSLIKNFLPNLNTQEDNTYQNKISNQSLGYPENFIDGKNENKNNNINNNFINNNFQLSNLLPLLNNKDGLSNLLSNFSSNNSNLVKSLSTFFERPQKKEQVEIPVHKSIDEIEID